MTVLTHQDVGVGLKPELTNEQRSVVDPDSPLAHQRSAHEVSKWGPEDVGKWACQTGFEEYAEALMEHKISGRTLANLGEAQLKEIGFDKVGPRLEFQASLHSLQRGHRMKLRNEVLWEADEYRLGPCYGCCPYAFPCCCCAQPPAHYRLNNYKLSLSFVDVSCPMFAHCFGFAFTTNNIDLDSVTDIDTHAIQPGCFKGIGTIIVQPGMRRPMKWIAHQGLCKRSLKKSKWQLKIQTYEHVQCSNILPPLFSDHFPLAEKRN